MQKRQHISYLPRSINQCDRCMIYLTPGFVELSCRQKGREIHPRGHVQPFHLRSLRVTTKRLQFVVPTPSLSTAGLTDEFTSLSLHTTLLIHFDQISVCHLRVVWLWDSSSRLVRGLQEVMGSHFLASIVIGLILALVGSRFFKVRPRIVK